MGFYTFAPQSVPVGGGTFTGSVTIGQNLGVDSVLNAFYTLIVGGLATFDAGTNTASSAPVLAPANTSGAAAQLSDHTRDYMLYLTVGSGGTAFSVAIGPTSTPANTIVSSGTATAGEVIAFRLPAGWWWEWSATTATLASQIAIGC